jgi:hypothetical protein
MCSYISGGWLVGVPDVIFHKNAVQAVIAAPKPTFVDHPPYSVRDDLSHTKAVVFEMPRNPILTRAHDRLRGPGHHRYSAGCGSGFVTGGALWGNLLGGGGLTGSAVGETGSSRGMTVYLLTGSPIRATTDLACWMVRKNLVPEK